MSRKSTGKRLRFEIFKRDNFICQYCGKQPPDVVLVVDHINPISNGGDNDPMNLITSCEVCNQGKADKLLTNISPRPDADLEWLEMQQEIVELRRYQIAKEERNRLTSLIISDLQELWWELVNEKSAPSDSVFHGWLMYATPEQIEYAIRITGAKSYKIFSFSDQLKYASACIRNIVNESKISQDQ